MLKSLGSSLLLTLSIAFGQAVLNTAQIAKRVAPAVVVIEGNTDDGHVAGSGFIVSKTGDIVTNLHVIKDLRTARVHLPDGQIFDSVSVVAIDERRDLAVIRIAAFDLSVLDLGNSNSVAVGERVVVVGNPRGLEGTVTAGILSAVRDSDGFKVLQTDAAVNPGNSGGPLVNDRGRAIGVVSFKLRSAEWLNFAIPINDVRGLLNTLHEPMSLEQVRKNLGSESISQYQDNGPSLKETLDWLKENIPLAAMHYVSSLGGTKDVTRRTIATRFDSCTISFDNVEVSIYEKYPHDPVTEVSRYTVPLGALKGGKINGICKECWAVYLEADSNVILNEDHVDLGNTTKSDAGKYAFLIFKDESIAQRVLKAFLHAADLCRGKEPF